MDQSEDRYALCKVLISDNGIDRAYCPVLEKEECKRRERRLEKACISLMDAEERVENAAVTGHEVNSNPGDEWLSP